MNSAEFFGKPMWFFRDKFSRNDEELEDFLAMSPPSLDPERADGGRARSLSQLTANVSPSYRTSILHGIFTVTLLFLCISQFLYPGWLNPGELKYKSNTFDTGFATDFPGSSAAIHGLVQKRFNSPLRELPNGTIYTPADPSGGPKYTGPPSPELDAAWKRLIGGRYYRLKPNEIGILNADQALDRLPPVNLSSVPAGSIYGGVDMLHSLHCINAIRKHMAGDYYKGRMGLSEEQMTLHIDHCLDQLRQAVLCHGDLTPVTLRKIWQGRERGLLLGETEREHTCRDSNAILDWLAKRREETGYLPY